MQRSRPLRTVRETFASYGSSLPNAPRRTRLGPSVTVADMDLSVAVGVQQLQIVERVLTTMTAPNPMVDVPRLFLGVERLPAHHTMASLLFP